MNPYTSLLEGLVSCYIGRIDENGIIVPQTPDEKTLAPKDIELDENAVQFYVPNEKTYEYIHGKAQYAPFNVLREDVNQSRGNDALNYLVGAAMVRNTRLLTTLLIVMRSIYSGKIKNGSYNISQLAADAKSTVEAAISDKEMVSFCKLIATQTMDYSGKYAHMSLTLKKHHTIAGTTHAGYVVASFPLYQLFKKAVDGNTDCIIGKEQVNPVGMAIYVAMIETLFVSAKGTGLMKFTSNKEHRFAPLGMTVLYALSVIEENMSAYITPSEHPFFRHIDRKWIVPYSRHGEYSKFIPFMAAGGASNAPSEEAKPAANAPAIRHKEERIAAVERMPVQEAPAATATAKRDPNAPFVRDWGKTLAEQTGGPRPNAPTAQDYQDHDREQLERRQRAELDRFYNERHQRQFVIGPDNREYETDRDGYVIKSTARRIEDHGRLRGRDDLRDDRDRDRINDRSDRNSRESAMREFFDKRWPSNAEIMGPDGRSYETDRDGYVTRNSGRQVDDDRDRSGRRSSYRDRGRYDRDDRDRGRSRRDYDDDYDDRYDRNRGRSRSRYR